MIDAQINCESALKMVIWYKFRTHTHVNVDLSVRKIYNIVKNVHLS